MDRRGFLMGAAGLLIPGQLVAGEWSGWSSDTRAPKGSAVDFWDQPRRLTVRRNQNKEALDIVYHANGRLHDDGYRQICWLMRDLRAGEAVAIDPRVLDLMCAMQAWVGYYGYRKPFLITSGYRTRKTNEGLEGAAKNSMHLYGKAADIIIPDLPVSFIGQLAQQYAAGGVGFYPSSGFVHIDTGRVRSWGRR